MYRHNLKFINKHFQNIQYNFIFIFIFLNSKELRVEYFRKIKVIYAVSDSKMNPLYYITFTTKSSSSNVFHLLPLYIFTQPLSVINFYMIFWDVIIAVVLMDTFNVEYLCNANDAIS